MEGKNIHIILSLGLLCFNVINAAEPQRNKRAICKDHADVCDLLYNYCRKPDYSQWMEDNCEKTCGKCHKSPSNSNINLNKAFHRYLL